MKRNRRGLALSEVVIITLLVALVVALAAGPVRSARKRSQMSVCAGHLRRLGQVAMMYAEDYGHYPEPQQWIHAGIDRRTLFCPEDDGHQAAGSSYTFRCMLPPAFRPYWENPHVAPETVLAICNHHLEQHEEVPGDPRTLSPPRYPYKLVLRAGGAVETLHVDQIRELIVPGDRPTFAWIYPGEAGYDRATR